MSENPGRTVLFVAGAGRSGTSTLAGLMKIMGLHVPEPEVEADATNPKGFGEPQWVVEKHEELLRDANVLVSDSRVEAWFDAGQEAGRGRNRNVVSEWLGPHFEVADELVVKDPRLSWFLSMWKAAAVRNDARPVFATMLRPPAEVVGSKQSHYNNRMGAAHLAASWVNMLLHTERGTRGENADPAAGRVFVRYGDLLDDWVKVTSHIGEVLDLSAVKHAGTGAIRNGHRFVDPGLRRMTQQLEDLSLPPTLHEIVVESWNNLNLLADPGGDTAAVRDTLDQLRDRYAELYAEAEAIARSSATAAANKAERKARREALPVPVAAARSTVREKIPPGMRRRLRQIAGRSR